MNIPIVSIRRCEGERNNSERLRFNGFVVRIQNLEFVNWGKNGFLKKEKEI